MALRFIYHYPETNGTEADMLDVGPLGDVAQAAERAGFTGMSLTEHPVPGARWLNSGGHQSLDPLIALGYVAAATRHLKLLTNLVVAPYRNPSLLAKTAATVDKLSQGRLILGLDTLVNVVGGTFRAPFLETTPKGWDALLTMNLKHVLHACSLAARRMRAGGRGGAIINITTIEAHRAAPGFAVYAAAKAAVEQFGRTLAVELAPDGIRVNNVAPDYVPTPNLAKLATAGDGGMSTPAGQRVAIPMGRAGLPEDISGCVVFLASKLSAFVTGTTLHPDGGTFASAGWFNWPGSGWANHLPSSVLERSGLEESAP